MWILQHLLSKPACLLQAEEASRVQQKHLEHVDFLRHQIARKQAHAEAQRQQLEEVQALLYGCRLMVNAAQGEQPVF